MGYDRYDRYDGYIGYDSDGYDSGKKKPVLDRKAHGLGESRSIFFANRATLVVEELDPVEKEIFNAKLRL